MEDTKEGLSVCQTVQGLPLACLQMLVKVNYTKRRKNMELNNTIHKDLPSVLNIPN